MERHDQEDKVTYATTKALTDRNELGGYSYPDNSITYLYRQTATAVQAHGTVDAV